MRAADRCREHFAGDRCTKTRGHAAIETDKEHTGKFARWTGTGDAKVRSAAQPRATRAQERKLDRWLRRLDPEAIRPEHRGQVKKFLDQLIAAPDGF